MNHSFFFFFFSVIVRCQHPSIYHNCWGDRGELCIIVAHKFWMFWETRCWMCRMLRRYSFSQSNLCHWGFAIIPKPYKKSSVWLIAVIKRACFSAISFAIDAPAPRIYVSFRRGRHGQLTTVVIETTVLFVFFFCFTLLQLPNYWIQNDQRINWAPFLGTPEHLLAIKEFHPSIDFKAKPLYFCLFCFFTASNLFLFFFCFGKQEFFHIVYEHRVNPHIWTSLALGNKLS